MSQLLENKVSHLMAEVKQLSKTISDLETRVDLQETEKNLLQETIANLEARVSEQRAEITNLGNENDDLKIKGGELSPVHFDKLNS